ncbi:MAG: MATE family efflux transporter [Lachnospiraceae bacterium]|nr:MATE family efflux transporter [Lachnospiraceae bacterium]
MKSYEMDMTTGSLWKKIMIFSVPLMFSNILQIVFNISDVAVVGKFAGPIALGSVGSTSILVTLSTGIVLGLSSGVSALTALYIGARDDSEVKKTVDTAALLMAFSGVLIMVVGIVLARTILTAMHTKEELMEGAVRYLRIYLLGTPALAMFNFGNAVLSAAGDTRRPLNYLTVAGVINVLLNLFFVIVCHIGVSGVAIASIISQYISAGLVLRLLLRSPEAFGLRIHSLRIDHGRLRQILGIGIPSALQYALFAVANLFVQTSVNYFDHVMVEGNSAAANSDPLVYDMMAAFYTACTSFIAQNLGAEKWDRIRKSFYICLLYSFMLGLFLGVGIYVLRYPFLGMFTNDQTVVDAGIRRLSVMALSYSISAFMDCTIAASRGLGRTVVPMLIVTAGSTVFRLLWIWTVFAHFRTIESLYLLYVVSWTVTAIPELIYFVHIFKSVEGTRQVA